MEIKPLHDQTLVIKRSEINLKSKKNKDSLISHKMMKIIKNEWFKQNLLILISSFVSLILIVYIILLSTIYKASWGAYILPIISISIFLYKLFKTFIDKRSLRTQLKKYEQDLKLEAKYTPAFLNDFYINAVKNQIFHNWLTFILLFYGIIITLLIWTLKDVSWWIFDFKSWIVSLIVDPNLWIKIFTISLILIFMFHLVFAIQRNKKKQDIKMYFGSDAFPMINEQQIKKSYNKTFIRLFILKLMIISLIPIILYLIFKRKKRK